MRCRTGYKVDGLRGKLSTEGKEGCAEGIWSWDVIISREDLKERYGTKDSTGGFQTEHVERRQDRIMSSVVQHQSEETIRNGGHGARPWLDGTPEESWEKDGCPSQPFFPAKKAQP